MAHATISGLQGVIVAAITPRSKTGEPNFGATFELIDYLCAARVGGIALFTAVGEYPAFTVDDRSRLTYLAVKRSRVPMLVGAGSATLDHSLALAREARSAGASAVLLPPPLCYRFDHDDIHEFYTQFAVQFGSGLPVVLGGGLEAASVGVLLESGRFAAIECGGDATDSLDDLRAGGTEVLVNHDRHFVNARSAGLGVISEAACAAPELSMALNQAILAGDGERIGKLEAQRRELLGWLERFPQPVAVKTAAAVRGIQIGALPVPLSAGKQRCLDQFREWFQGWLPASKKLAAHG